MKNVKNNANNQDKMAALRIAEIKATDLEDLKDCANDMTRTASLSSDEAIVVAKAIRAKYLPNLAKQAGLDERNVKNLINLDNGIEDTANFATDNNEDEDEDNEMHHFENDEEDLDEDYTNDEAEVDDPEMAKFEIEVPADMVDAAQEAVQKALDELLGGMDDSEEFEDDEELDFSDEDDEEEDFDDSDDDMDMEEDSEQMHKLSNGVKKMSKNAQNSRRAEREEILKKLAMAPEEYDVAAAPKNYKSTEDFNLPGQKKFQTQTLENSGSNSLKDENPTWAEQKLFTTDKEKIQSKDQFTSFTLPGKSEPYVLHFDDLEVPSEGQMFDTPTVPTQMEHQTHNTTVMRTASDKVAVECTTCGYRMSLAEDQMDSASCPKCDHEDGKKEDKDTEAGMIDVKNPATKVTISSDDSKKVIALETARIKTAFSCSSKLAVAGIIDANEMDSYADQMLNDGLKADAMIRQTKLLLKSSQTNTERVAAAAADRMNSVRTASTMGISTSPAFSGGFTSNGAALDIQAALKGTWSMPQIED